jgi:hypothetical protein
MLKRRVENIVSGATDAVTGALDARANSVTVRLEAENLERIDELVEAEFVANRGDAVVFLVAEGIKASADIFDQIHDGFQKIREVKEQLRSLGGGVASGTEAAAPEQQATANPD